MRRNKPKLREAKMWTDSHDYRVDEPTEDEREALRVLSALDGIFSPQTPEDPS